MRVRSFRVAGLRCFVDTGEIVLSPTSNIFVGQNNTGKSTLLKAVLAFQGFPFSRDDFRPNCPHLFHDMFLEDIDRKDHLRLGEAEAKAKGIAHVVKTWLGDAPETPTKVPRIVVKDDQGAFSTNRPNHSIVPFLARRKAMTFEHNVNSSVQQQVTGTFANLYSRIDSIANWGHVRHDDFKRAIEEVIGLKITTRSSPSGKVAGFHLDEDNFVTLDRMGDGVTELVALIVELCLERKKIFVLEEPETNLHPRGLKALMGMVRSSMAENQFIIATHSNIVVRELASDSTTNVFRVYRDEGALPAASHVQLVPRAPVARRELLRELGYEFADLELHEGWLFLEEASAETIIRDILIPNFAPKLRNRLRTFSAGGAGNVEPSVGEFQRLVTFIHLQPAYEGRMWIRTDGDPAGQSAAAALREKFSYLTDATCTPFKQTHFEMYYPRQFEARAAAVIEKARGPAKRSEKEQLLLDVVGWTKSNGTEALMQWQSSAAEPIDMLRMIEATLA